jgi:uncharacterized protein with GYD domain
MPLYMHQAAYTGESKAAQIRNPEDRLEVATKPAVEAVGGRLIAGGYSFGEYDLIAVFEAPDDVRAAAVALAIDAGGAVRDARTTRLLSGSEWVEALRRAPTVANAYRPALPDSFMPTESTLAETEGFLPGPYPRAT